VEFMGHPQCLANTGHRYIIGRQLPGPDAILEKE